MWKEFSTSVKKKVDSNARILILLQAQMYAIFSTSKALLANVLPFEMRIYTCKHKVFGIQYEIFLNYKYSSEVISRIFIVKVYFGNSILSPFMVILTKYSFCMFLSTTLVLSHEDLCSLGFVEVLLKVKCSFSFFGVEKSVIYGSGILVK